MAKTVRQQWFLDRIGKTIYRNKTTCECGVCQHVYENGLVLGDEQHADYVSDMEGMAFYENYNLRYFDTVEERDNYELELKNKDNGQQITS